MLIENIAAIKPGTCRQTSKKLKSQGSEKITEAAVSGEAL
jgi:hypothetical protein